MKKTMLCLVLVLMICCVSTVSADWKVSGFGFFVNKWEEKTEEIKEESQSKLSLKHLWLIGKQKLSDEMSVIIILTPKGPPRLVNNLMFKWKSPVKGVDMVTVGRFIPPFTREWSTTRPDHLKTINYSTLFKPLVLKDEGIKLEGGLWRFGEDGLQRFNWKVAVLGSSERLNGPERERKTGRWHFYQRSVVKLPFHTEIGGSYRWSNRDQKLWAVEACYDHNPFFVSAEIVRAKKKEGEYKPEGYILTGCQIGTGVKTVFRYEELDGGRNFIPGIGFSFREAYEVKINVTIPQGWEENISKTEIQFLGKF